MCSNPVGLRFSGETLAVKQEKVNRHDRFAVAVIRRNLNHGQLLSLPSSATFQRSSPSISVHS